MLSPGAFYSTGACTSIPSAAFNLEMTPREARPATAETGSAVIGTRRPLFVTITAARCVHSIPRLVTFSTPK